MLHLTYTVVQVNVQYEIHVLRNEVCNVKIYMIRKYTVIIPNLMMPTVLISTITILV